MADQVKAGGTEAKNAGLFRDANWIRSIYHGMIDGIVIFDGDGRVVSVNPAGESVIGKLEGEVIGRREIGLPSVEALIAAADPVAAASKVKCWEVKSCTHPECPSFKSDDLRCWLQCGTFCHNEIQGTFKQKRDACERCDVYIKNGIGCIELEHKGQQYTAQVSPILDELGQEQGRMALFHNITDLRQAQKNLIQRNEGLTLLNGISARMARSLEGNGEVLAEVLKAIVGPAGIAGGALILGDEETGQLQLAAYYGFGSEALSAWKSQLFQLGHIADLEGSCDDVQRRCRNFILTCVAGPERRSGQLEALTAPLRLGEKNIGILVLAGSAEELLKRDQGLLDNIANQMSMYIHNARLFRDISKTKREWEATFDAMTDLVSIHDADFNIIRANRSMIERFGPDCLGRKCYEVFHKRSCPPDSCPTAAVLKHGRGVSAELDDDMLGPIIVSIDPIFTSDGEICAFAHVVKDIAEPRKLRAQLLQSEKMAAVGQLVSGVAHELNNPLASIMGYSQYLLMRQSGSQEEALTADLQTVYQEAERASKIVKNLLSFARKHEAQKSCTDLNQTIVKILSLRDYELKLANIEVETELEQSLPLVMVDAHQIEQVLLNLINNAEQSIAAAGRDSGLITIASAADEGAVKIAVGDNGGGIRPEDISKVFDPFFTTKEVGKGTGLGLSICYGIAKEHGGDIQVHSLPERGATFTLTLPSSGCLERSEPVAAPEDDSRAAPAATGGHILVVDDERSIGRLLQETLADASYEIDYVADGQAALEALAESPYDAVVTDIKMPEMDGKELFARIGELDRELAERVIFITGDTISSETQEFLSCHDNPALVKPFDLEELESIIEKLSLQWKKS